MSSGNFGVGSACRVSPSGGLFDWKSLLPSGRYPHHEKWNALVTS